MEDVSPHPRAIPPIGFGTSKDDLDRVRDALRCAFKAGYRMVDTAAFYKNEVQVGEAIQDAIQSGFLTREDIFVITKLPHIGAHRVRHFLQASLQKLKLDYVDLYLIHGPTFYKYGKDDEDLIPRVNGQPQYDHTHYLDVWKDMEKCVDEGLCRSIGVSNFNAEQLEDVWRNARIKPTNIQNECHVHLQEESLLKKCQELGVTITAFAPLGSPSYDKFIQNSFKKDMNSFSNVLEEPLLQELAEKHKKTTAQIALRWLVQRGITPIPKSFSEERIKENIQIFDFSLTDDDMKRISLVNKNIRNFTYKEISEGIEDHPQYAFK